MITITRLVTIDAMLHRTLIAEIRAEAHLRRAQRLVGELRHPADSAPSSASPPVVRLSCPVRRSA